MSTKILVGKIETADELRDFVNVDAAILATSEKGTTFETKFARRYSVRVSRRRNKR